MEESITSLPTLRNSDAFKTLGWPTLGQLQLQEEVALNLVPMVKELPTGRKKSARWISQFGKELGPSSTNRDTVGSASGLVGADVASTSIPISLKPEDTVWYEGSTLTEIRPGVFYVPRLSNQVAFYPFILANHVLYIVQITIAALHEIKEGIVDFFLFATSAPFDIAMFGVAFRLYCPPGETAICPESSSARLRRFWKAKLFSAEFDSEKRIGVQYN